MHLNTTDVLSCAVTPAFHAHRPPVLAQGHSRSSSVPSTAAPVAAPPAAPAAPPPPAGARVMAGSSTAGSGPHTPALAASCRRARERRAPQASGTVPVSWLEDRLLRENGRVSLRRAGLRGKSRQSMVWRVPRMVVHRAWVELRIGWASRVPVLRCGTLQQSSTALIGLHLLQRGEPRPRGRQCALQPIATEVQVPQRCQPAAGATAATGADGEAPTATATSTSHAEAGSTSPLLRQRAHEAVGREVPANSGDRA